jgi:hypothetical protein
VLEFTGRRTGRAYRVVTGWHQVDGQEFAVTPAPWRANLEGGAPLAVTHRGRRRTGRGELVKEPAVVADAVQRLLRQGTSARALGMAIANGYQFTGDDVVRRRRALVRFTPDVA